MKLKKLCYVASVVLATGLMPNASAQYWHWTGLAGDGLWHSPANWDNGEDGAADECGNRES